MEVLKQELIDYLYDYFAYLLHLKDKAKVHYPYLNEIERNLEKERIARTLLSKYSDKVFINNCPKCGKLARTPKAKQCRYCGHDWH